MAEVVTLSGEALTYAGKPDAAVIKALEALLGMAKSGEIVSFAGVAAHADRATSTWHGGQTLIYPIIGAMEALKHEILVSLK